MDISDTIAPNSDQLDAVDLLAGPRTFTIKKVSAGNAEQPVNIDLVEFPRTWRPGKSMRRVLVACWGPDAATYVGRRLTLYCDPTVRFGGQEIGGTRISHLSHLERRKQVPLLVSRGKSAMFVVEPLVETNKDRAAKRGDEIDWDARIAEAGGDVEKVRALYEEAKGLYGSTRPDLAEKLARAGKAAKEAAEPADDPDNQLRADDPDLTAGSTP
ncbi:hypothetical protein [Amycolatopsis sp. NPDC059657]|uniref:hypothetical protein n=1 Tax=Amycolatopsis sp. NPDC059657 TaxID=3346899 RepID=UPI00366BB42C